MITRRNASILTLVAALAVMSLITVFADNEEFADVRQGAWYAKAVAYCKDTGLISGMTKTTFSPDAIMSRGMVAAILYRQAGKPMASKTIQFSDVMPGAWYETSVSWAMDQGIMSGYGNGRFGPNDPVTREQMAAILWKYAGSPSANAITVSFSDRGCIAAWAMDASAWANSNGFIQGKSGNVFDPKGNATRAEMAVVLYQYLSGNQTSAEDGTGSISVENEPSDGKITIEMGDSMIQAVIYDNSAGKDFISKLPLTLNIQDYAGSEKIAYLQEKLSTEGMDGYDPQIGDIAFYEPWGNLAIFYEDAGFSNDLKPVGHIVSGLETLSNVNWNFTVTIKQAE